MGWEALLPCTASLGLQPGVPPLGDRPLQQLGFSMGNLVSSALLCLFAQCTDHRAARPALPLCSVY